MQTTLRLNDQIFRDAKAEAARQGVTLTRFIEEALKERLAQGQPAPSQAAAERNRLMEELLMATAHFRVGEHPSREQMDER